jgi:hypothetical protein
MDKDNYNNSNKVQQQSEGRARARGRGRGRRLIPLARKHISFSFSLSGEVINELNKRFPNKGQRSGFAEAVLRTALGI